MAYYFFPGENPVCLEELESDTESDTESDQTHRERQDLTCALALNNIKEKPSKKLYRIFFKTKLNQLCAQTRRKKCSKRCGKTCVIGCFIRDANRAENTDILCTFSEEVAPEETAPEEAAPEEAVPENEVASEKVAPEDELVPKAKKLTKDEIYIHMASVLLYYKAHLSDFSEPLKSSEQTSTKKVHFS